MSDKPKAERGETKPADVRILLNGRQSQIFINGQDISRSVMNFSVGLEDGITVVTLRLLARSWITEGQAEVRIEKSTTPPGAHVSEEVRRRTDAAYAAIEGKKPS